MKYNSYFQIYRKENRIKQVLCISIFWGTILSVSQFKKRKEKKTAIKPESQSSQSEAFFGPE